MQSLLFTPGDAYLAADSSTYPWYVVFEDEGVAAYFYACDRTRGTDDDAIVDAMLVYNVSSLRDPEKQRLASIQWSRDGMQAVMYLDGVAQGLFDFAKRIGSCRLDFPNFMAAQGETWRQSSHAWDDEALRTFESGLYAEPAN
ncbi:hypothetical protein SAMN05421771_0835 [Granulicella pectinivorans]|jgi:hypothetical protein|uniref:DUF2251 domain-containing protein n=1 Tax=Granulicella pectinivorans TaxID=474950 RepID=A0A1I6LKM2_9BACT|nr:DUF2251 domain-containing protein [Granulicella pectinivorans]SFS03943.1 hypothetical protein SAMN05421771_0835 [Granulicella pectinivorans]